MDHFKPVLLDACRELYGGNLITLALFGSWARGVASPCSDIDLLVVAEKLPDGRMKRMTQFDAVENATKETRSQIWQNILEPNPPVPELSPVLKTPDEVVVGSPLFLDMTDYVDLIFDHNNFFSGYLADLRMRMQKSGARRKPIAGGYYWEYKPGMKSSETVVL